MYIITTNLLKSTSVLLSIYNIRNGTLAQAPAAHSHQTHPMLCCQTIKMKAMKTKQLTMVI